MAEPSLASQPTPAVTESPRKVVILDHAGCDADLVAMEIAERGGDVQRFNCPNETLAYLGATDIAVDVLVVAHPIAGWDSCEYLEKCKAVGSPRHVLMLMRGADKTVSHLCRHSGESNECSVLYKPVSVQHLRTALRELGL